MPVHYIAALARYTADSYTALTQLTSYIPTTPNFSQQSATYSTRWEALHTSRALRLETIAKAALPKDGQFGTGHLCATLRKLCPSDTIFAVEAVTNSFFVADNLQCTLPGSWINCGGGGLGWSGGGALGIKLASSCSQDGGKFVVQIVGDGTFLFSVPSSVYWISQRYSLPILTIVLSNKGWNAPKKSLLLVHPDGLGSKTSNADMHIEIAGPDFGGIAKASAGGNCYAGKVSEVGELEKVLLEAIGSVKEGTTAVVEAVVASGC
jgi:thiamine pyrophosphate-dependent acetolactate synthase large subunit-like protein